MAVNERIAKMRQVSKGPPLIPVKVDFERLWMLVECETGRTIGVFTTEEMAWNESEAIQIVYQIETEVEPVLLDGKLSQGEYAG